MTTEWAIQEKTFIDGDFDRIQTGHGFPTKPFTREEAEEIVERQNKRYDTVWQRVVSREVTDWTPVEEAELDEHCGCRVCVNRYADKISDSGADFASVLSARAGVFVMCSDCGNKRCPKGTFHGHECSKDNTPGQVGSTYGNLHFASAKCAGCDYLERRND